MEVRYRTNKLKEKEDVLTPGPSSYRHPVESSKKDYNRTASPAFGFGTSPKQEARIGGRAGTPGPGAYDYSPRVGIEAARATIGNAARSTTNLLKAAKMPSPFEYNTSAEYCLKKEPAYTIGRSQRPNTAGEMTRSKSTSNIPGPADYAIDQQTFLKKAPVATIPN